MEDEDGPLVDRQPPEATLELVAIGHRALVGSGVAGPSSGRARIWSLQRRRRSASA